VVHDEITVQRERVQPIPDLQLRGASGYNFESNKAVAAGIEVGFNIPVWNRNQGTIRQAQADLMWSRAEVVRVQLSLRQRLADTFNQYRTAWQAAEIYRNAIIPQTTQAYEVQLDMYKKRRIAWPEVVMLQRKTFEAKSQYTRSLLRMREAEVAIHGLLLVDGLTSPPTPQANEQLEATPQPR
jgi:cobalt-zinc-cadmium efflux system outer membrane protein